MKLSKARRAIAASILSLAATLTVVSCGSDSTAGFLFVPVTNLAGATGGGGINVFREEHDFGKLTLLNKTPVSSGGANPLRALIAGGGRFLYVVNQGSGKVEVFSVGGDGALAQQTGGSTTQGTSPVDIAIDGAGGHLYAIDQIAPAGAPCPNGTTQPANPTPATSLCGDITAFNVDANTGRLSLIQNQNLTNADGTQLTYFPVGQNPIKVLIAGTFIYTLDQGDSTVFPYALGANGQLTLTQNGPLVTGGVNLTAIATDGGSRIYLADATLNQIFAFNVGSGGALSAQGPPVPNQSGAENPSALLIDNSRKFLYVANRSNSNPNLGNSSISAFTISTSSNASGQVLQPIAGGPYPTDSGPLCMIVDPSGQYIYTSAFDASRVNGKVINTTTGELQDLRRGTTFATTGNPTCLIGSGRT